MRRAANRANSSSRGRALTPAIILSLLSSGCVRYLEVGQFSERATDEGGVAGADAGLDASTAALRCGPLPTPTGPTIQVNPSMTRELSTIVREAAAGTTILLEDGTYALPSDGRMRFLRPGVTLRSQSGNATAVIIDGGHQVAELISIHANRVTIADLTLRRATAHLVHVYPTDSNVTDTQLHNLRLFDAQEQFVKINPDASRTRFVDRGSVSCSEFLLSPAGRDQVKTEPTPCYTGGVDVISGRDWTVRDNRFEGIHCTNGSPAEHAVHIWQGSRDSLVERNLIIDCARGIGFGLGEDNPSRDYSDQPHAGLSPLGHVDGIIRNNIIHASHQALPWFDTGIDLAQARGAIVAHNTIASTATYSSIDYRFANTSVRLQNNITWRITRRDGAQAQLVTNLENADPSWFVDAESVDYRLLSTATAALGQATPLAEVDADITGQPRDDPPDIGAHEGAF